MRKQVPNEWLTGSHFSQDLAAWSYRSALTGELQPRFIVSSSWSSKGFKTSRAVTARREIDMLSDDQWTRARARGDLGTLAVKAEVFAGRRKKA